MSWDNESECNGMMGWMSWDDGGGCDVMIEVDVIR